MPAVVNQQWGEISLISSPLGLCRSLLLLQFGAPTRPTLTYFASVTAPGPGALGIIDTPLILLLAAAFSAFAHCFPLSRRTSAQPSFRFNLFIGISFSPAC